MEGTFGFVAKVAEKIASSEVGGSDDATQRPLHQLHSPTFAVEIFKKALKRISDCKHICQKGTGYEIVKNRF